MPGYTRPTIDAREFRDEFGAGADQWGPQQIAHTTGLAFTFGRSINRISIGYRSGMDDGQFPNDLRADTAGRAACLGYRRTKDAQVRMSNVTRDTTRVVFAMDPRAGKS